MAQDPKIENRADSIPYIIAAEVGAPLIGALATPDGEHPYIDGRTIIVIKGKVAEIKGETAVELLVGRDKQISEFAEQLANKDAEIERLSAVNSQAALPPTRSFEVVKQYAGIDKDEIVTSADAYLILYMLKNGYWKEM